MSHIRLHPLWFLAFHATSGSWRASSTCLLTAYCSVYKFLPTGQEGTVADWTGPVGGPMEGKPVSRPVAAPSIDIHMASNNARMTRAARTNRR